MNQTNQSTYFSPAKINLYLKVLGKRPDGYHNLSTLMQTVDLGDTLHFAWGDPDKLTCTDPTIPTDSTNLVTKAITLFRSKTGWNESVHIHLDKKIPSQAGLGGGSSNAATTLWALNEKAGRPATLKQLQDWSAEIGSDIPFFFSHGTALCEGRGEIVTNLPPRSSKPFFVVKPSIGLSTAAVFKHFKLSETHSEDEYFNDLENPSFSLYPELAALKQQLQESGFSPVLMSGSGSALFCMGTEKKLPLLSSVAIYPTKFLNRSFDTWYEKYR